VLIYCKQKQNLTNNVWPADELNKHDKGIKPTLL